MGTDQGLICRLELHTNGIFSVILLGALDEVNEAVKGVEESVRKLVR